MRGQKSKMKQMKLGRTIAAEREHVESESERMMARKKVHRRQTTSVLMVILMLAILGLIGYLGMKEMVEKEVIETTPQDIKQQVKAQIVDEDNRGQISMRTMNYILQLEGDLRDLGYEVTKVTLPTGKSRELYIDIAGVGAFFKVNTDRESALVAEDVSRMVKYLKEKNLQPKYVDVRVEGKAYYQ